MKLIRKYIQRWSGVLVPMWTAVTLMSIFTNQIGTSNPIKLQVEVEVQVQEDTLHDRLFLPEKIQHNEFTLPVKLLDVPLIHTLFVGIFHFKSLVFDISSALSENLFIFFRNNYYTYTFINAP